MMIMVIFYMCSPCIVEIFTVHCCNNLSQFDVARAKPTVTSPKTILPSVWTHLLHCSWKRLFLDIAGVFFVGIFGI